MADRVITQDQCQALVNYLAKQTYAEVFQLVNMLAGLPELKEEGTDERSIAKTNKP